MLSYLLLFISFSFLLAGSLSLFFSIVYLFIHIQSLNFRISCSRMLHDKKKGDTFHKSVKEKNKEKNIERTINAWAKTSEEKKGKGTLMFLTTLSLYPSLFSLLPLLLLLLLSFDPLSYPFPLFTFLLIPFLSSSLALRYCLARIQMGPGEERWQWICTQSGVIGQRKGRRRG